MGVDTAYMSKNFKKAFYIEQNADLLNITKYNFEQLGIENVTFLEGNSVEKLSKATPSELNQIQHSWIYLDPHRRDDAGSKVVRLQDCEPNIIAIKDLLFEHTDNILLKASPMLDIDLAISELKNVSKVCIVAVENEVKEVLFHLQKDIIDNVILNAVNIIKQTAEGNSIVGRNYRQDLLSFTKSEEKNANVLLGSPKEYLYEPNAAIMKSGGFRHIAQYFDLQKIAPHSHLYTSEELIENFQGRIFKVLAVCRLDKKEISKYLSENKANITIRNFPLTVQQIRDKLKLSDGGSEYLFATTDTQNKRIMIVCRKIQPDNINLISTPILHHK